MGKIFKPGDPATVVLLRAGMFWCVGVERVEPVEKPDSMETSLSTVDSLISTGLVWLSFGVWKEEKKILKSQVFLQC